VEETLSVTDEMCHKHWAQYYNANKQKCTTIDRCEVSFSRDKIQRRDADTDISSCSETMRLKFNRYDVSYRDLPFKDISIMVLNDDRNDIVLLCELDHSAVLNIIELFRDTII